MVQSRPALAAAGRGNPANTGGGAQQFTGNTTHSRRISAAGNHSCKGRGLRETDSIGDRRVAAAACCRTIFHTRRGSGRQTTGRATIRICQHGRGQPDQRGNSFEKRPVADHPGEIRQGRFQLAGQRPGRRRKPALRGVLGRGQKRLEPEHARPRLEAGTRRRRSRHRKARHRLRHGRGQGTGRVVHLQQPPARRLEGESRGRQRRPRLPAGRGRRQ